MLKKITSLISATSQFINSKFDGFSNVLTGLNTARDKTSAFFIMKSKKLSYNELDTLIRDNKMAKKVCIKPAMEIVKEELELCIDDEILEEEFEVFLSPFYEKFMTALFWENGFGGSAILLDIEDGRELNEPVDVENITGFGKRVLILDKSYIYCDNYNPLKETELYFINIQGEGTIYIHKDRLLLFKGHSSTINERMENLGFSDSILQSSYSAIRNYTVAHDTCANILNDFSQTVYKIDGLNDDLDNEQGEADIIKRLLLMEQTRSIVRAVVIDAKDDFLRQVANVSGLKDFIAIFKEYLVAMFDIPHNILLGEKTEGGLGQSGKTQMEQWKDFLTSEQNRIRPNWDKLIKYYSAYKGMDKPKWHYANLYKLDEIEEATVEKENSIAFKNYSDGVKKLWETQAISSDEITQMISEKKDTLFQKVGTKISGLLGSIKW